MDRSRSASTITNLPQPDIVTLRPELRAVIENRKSGLSVNHIIGCPLECAYCVRHLFQNYAMKRPHALLSDDQAVEALLASQYFIPHSTPIQLLNRATDPFLPNVKPHTFSVLNNLDQRELTNHVLIITRYIISEEDCAWLNTLTNIRLTLLVTHSGINDRRIEPIDSKIARDSLRTAFGLANRYRVILYWRPLVPGLNTSVEHIDQAIALSKHAHATVFTGLFYRQEIDDYYRSLDLPLPYEGVARRKILPQRVEQSILTSFAEFPSIALFRKTSCAVSFAHGLADYNGHETVHEICDICPAFQRSRCQNAGKGKDESVIAAAKLMGATSAKASERAIVVTGLSEEQRYYLQHSHRYQIHDSRHPHKVLRHGRSDIGWDTRDDF